jgi:hypothetical protein
MVTFARVSEGNYQLDSRTIFFRKSLMAIEIIRDAGQTCSLRAMGTISATLSLSIPMSEA